VAGRVGDAGIQPLGVFDRRGGLAEVVGDRGCQPVIAVGRLAVVRN